MIHDSGRHDDDHDDDDHYDVLKLTVDALPKVSTTAPILGLS